MTVQDISVAEETLDPADWGEARALAHRMVEDAIDHLQGLRERPLWQEMPASVRSGFVAAVPQGPQPLDAIYSEMTANLMPLSDGQQASAVLDVVHGGGKLYRGFGGFSGGD